ncbi:MAG: hypothetical protein R3C14_11285 [Caldilineaceae bacterium]
MESPNDNFFDDEQEKIQRILNEKKRRELAERYGASFGESDVQMPAEAEAEWLNYIEEFERQFEDAERISVRAYLGNPHVRPLMAIAPPQLEEELDNLLEFMFLNGIAVHFLAEVADSEAYRFILEELFDEKIDNVRIPGMTTNFIYEEFHPNDEHDAKIWANDFLLSLFDHHREGVEIALSRDELYDRRGAPITHAAMMRRVDAFFARHPQITDTKITPLTCKLEGEYAQVEVATTWTSVHTNPKEMIQFVGRSHFRLKRSSYGGWDIVQADIAGWDSPTL